jgi:hypothetical protein
MQRQAHFELLEPTMRFILATLAFCASASAFATTATVFTPDVNEGDRSFEYRASFVPDSGLDADVFFQRLHFQYAFDDSWRARLVVNHRSVDGESLDYRSSRLEVQWQYREDQEHGWDAALRFDVEVGDESPDQVRLLWTVQRNFAERWQIRGNVALGRAFGASAAHGVLLATSAQLTYGLGGGKRLGIEMFNGFNSTANVGSYDQQVHKLGPIFKMNFGRKWTMHAGYLAGISESAADHDWRLMIIHRL